MILVIGGAGQIDSHTVLALSRAGVRRNLIPLVLHAVAGRRGEAHILVTDYTPPDGTCIRDYVHVDDLAWAHVAGIERLLDGAIASQPLNLGTVRRLGARGDQRGQAGEADQLQGRRVAAPVGRSVPSGDLTQTRALLDWRPECLCRPADRDPDRSLWSLRVTHH